MIKVKDKLSFMVIGKDNQVLRHAHVDYRWEKSVCYAVLTNIGDQPLQIKEIIWLQSDLSEMRKVRIYGEGYNMLSQYEGELEAPQLIGTFSDRDHYRMPHTEELHSVYNLLLLSQDEGEHMLLGYASCNRFRGEFRFGAGRLEAVLNTEGMLLKAGEQWELEVLFVQEGLNRDELLDSLAECIAACHPPLPIAEAPTGWCSWYGYGPEITEALIMDNLEVISDNKLPLKYIQIDDGYQDRMGDWLIPGSGFSSNMKELCRTIRERGYEPAIWVAPFIAEKDSLLYREHPDWFIQHESDKRALLSNEISFGGWRNGPWYMLDGTHPEAREYLSHVFKTMRREWGCRYFKLDANMWGALPFGRRYDPNATSIEAYRRGMQSILQSAGEDSFVLGCNAPMWPSLGLVHGMRITDDISRDWSAIKLLARQGFHRNWQHGRLWMNDPDCIVLDNLSKVLPGPDGVDRVIRTKLSDAELQFHATYIYASGGMVLSGDRLVDFTPERMQRLSKYLPSADVAAKFQDQSFQVGITQITDAHQVISLFNWEDEQASFKVPLPWQAKLTDEDLAVNLGVGNELRATVPARSARRISCIRM